MLQWSAVNQDLDFKKDALQASNEKPVGRMTWQFGRLLSVLRHFRRWAAPLRDWSVLCGTHDDNNGKIWVLSSKLARRAVQTNKGNMQSSLIEEVLLICSIISKARLWKIWMTSRVSTLVNMENLCCQGCRNTLAASEYLGALFRDSALHVFSNIGFEVAALKKGLN